MLVEVLEFPLASLDLQHVELCFFVKCFERMNRMKHYTNLARYL